MDGPVNLQGVQNVLNEILQSLNALTQQVKDTFQLPAYLTGNWTPALAFGGSVTGITYSTQSGTYTLIGREVTCRFRVVLTSKGAQVGNATIGGLPFAANAGVTNNGSGGLCPVYSNMATVTETPAVNVPASGVSASLLTFGAAASASLTDANFTNTTVLNGQFSYFI